MQLFFCRRIVFCAPEGMVSKKRCEMKFKITKKDRAELCRRAPEFAPAVAAVELQEFECDGNLFTALVWSVISQQLSGRVAQVICDRVEALLEEVTPEKLLATEVESLRKCGLSARKVEYLRGAAEAALAGAVDFAGAAKLPDAELIGELTRLRGVGVWTAEMLLIFALGRRDVLSYKDLGIRRGMMRLYGLEELGEEAFEMHRERYSPYGTLASLYLWRADEWIAEK